eukprot:Tbor_TRINITY_DN4975_c5_g2::TRINITY_DN4975_c5_g2_i3::g.9951::m.9951
MPHLDPKLDNPNSNRSMALSLKIEEIYNDSLESKNKKFRDLKSPWDLMQIAQQVAWEIMKLPHDEPIPDEQILELDGLTADLLQPYLDANKISELMDEEIVREEMEREQKELAKSIPTLYPSSEHLQVPSAYHKECPPPRKVVSAGWV